MLFKILVFVKVREYSENQLFHILWITPWFSYSVSSSRDPSYVQTRVYNNFTALSKSRKVLDDLKTSFTCSLTLALLSGSIKNKVLLVGIGGWQVPGRLSQDDLRFTEKRISTEFQIIAVQFREPLG